MMPCARFSATLARVTDMVLLAAALQACSASPLPPEPPIVTTVANASCVAACRNLAAWHCAEAAGDAIEPCPETCVRAEAAGFDLASRCIAAAKSLVEGKACRTRNRSQALRCSD